MEVPVPRVATLIPLLIATCLLATLPLYADGVTVLIHGWHVTSGEPVWPPAMQTAIAGQRLAGEQSFGTITVTGSPGSLTATCDPWNVDLASSTTGEIVVRVNWSAVANHLLYGVTAQEVAAVVAPKLYQGQSGQRPLTELPVHLVGHSRGGGMVLELARLLGEQGIEVDHVTVLDAHPLTAADPQPVMPPAVIDTPVAVYENVLFADSYWQQISYPQGEYVAGAYNREWISMPGGYHDHASTAYSDVADHLNIHLMYHATVDLRTPTGDGEATVDTAERTDWFNTYEGDGEGTGFVYSRIDGAGDRLSQDQPVAGGDAIRDGYHSAALLGGAGARSALGWSAAVWPNVVLLNVLDGGSPLPAGTARISPGDLLDLHIVGRDADSAVNLTLVLDADRNPYNGNDITTIDTATDAAASSSLFTVDRAWDTSALTAGTTGYVAVHITDGSRTRHLYAAPQIEVIDSAEIFSDDFDSGTTSSWSATTP